MNENAVSNVLNKSCVQMAGNLESAFVIICLVFSEVIDGYLLIRPRNTVVLLGDIVELDCVTNTSLSLDWRLKRYGGNENKNDWISRGNKTGQNISEAFRILTTKLGQFALVIDHVLMSHAGRYSCDDRDGANPSFAEVTLLNRTPSCDESSGSLRKKIVCSFGYAGNLTPELEWMTLGNSSWIASCKASNDSVECLFESTGTCAVNKLSLNTNTFLTFCIEECNTTCEWGDSSSSVGLLQIKGYNKTVGSWHCRPTSTGCPTTTQLSSESGLTDIQKTAKNNYETVIGLGTAVIILAASTIGFFVGFLIVLKRIRQAKKELSISSNVTGLHNVKTASGYEEMQETPEQSSGLPVYHNVQVLQTEYQELAVIDQ